MVVDKEVDEEVNHIPGSKQKRCSSDLMGKVASACAGWTLSAICSPLSGSACRRKQCASDEAFGL